MRNLEKVKQLAPDLRQTEPRATHEELGGEPHAARTLDKARATLAGVNGEYRFGCPMDQHFFEETGIDMREFEDLVATGASDAEVGDWIREHVSAKRRVP